MRIDPPSGVGGVYPPGGLPPSFPGRAWDDITAITDRNDPWFGLTGRTSKTLDDLKNNLDKLKDYFSSNGTPEQKQMIDDLYDKFAQASNNFTYPSYDSHLSEEENLGKITQLWENVLNVDKSTADQMISDLRKNNRPFP